MRALLIDDQVWFILSDFCRVTGYPHEERLAIRMADSQVRQERLNENSLESDYVLLSESAVYQALVLFNAPDDRSLRRWISGTVVPQGRSQSNVVGPRYVQLQFERHRLQVLDWKDDLWVSFGDLPRVLGGRQIAGRSGWRGWARRLRM